MNCIMPVRSFLLVTAVAVSSACSNTQPQEQRTEPAVVPVPQEATTPAPAEGTFCFLEALNKDTTRVRLTITGDKVEGTMDWIPNEKDGARGTLSGERSRAGELILLYSYMIEGSAQTETRIMKIENGELWMKKGPLEDPNSDGNLRYVDAALATYSASLPAVLCR